MKYNANQEFTWANLKDTCLSLTTNGYTSLNCQDYYDITHSEKQLPEKSAIMRVDVDRNVVKAVKMARIFAETNIRATFYFRLHSEFYNLLGYENLLAFKTIESMGFDIGLHCEPVDMAHVLSEPAENSIRRDIAILNQITNKPIRSAACHRNSSGLNNLDFWSDQKPEDYGLDFEAYDPETYGLFENGTYISESPIDKWKIYRKGIQDPSDTRTLTEIANTGESPLYILVHPFVFRDNHFFESS